MKRILLVMALLVLVNPLWADSNTLVEFRFESSQPAFNSPEVLRIDFSNSLAFYSGLNVQGQGRSWQHYEASETPLSPEDVRELLVLLSNLEGMFRRNLWGISEDNRDYPRLVFVWEDSRGNETIRYYRFPHSRRMDHPLYSMTERYAGHSFWETLYCRYD